MAQTLKQSKGGRRFRVDLSGLEGCAKTQAEVVEAMLNGDITPEQANSAHAGIKGVVYLKAKLPMEVNLLLLRFQGRPPVGLPLFSIEGRGPRMLEEGAEKDK
ncbi:MAG: hypothetical protein ACREKK_08765 [Candidatus Methylomirabilales bacterium]